MCFCACMGTRARASACAWLHTCVRVCVCVCVCMGTRTCMLLCVDLRLHGNTRLRARTCALVRGCVCLPCTHACAWARTSACLRARPCAMCRRSVGVSVHTHVCLCLPVCTQHTARLSVRLSPAVPPAASSTCACVWSLCRGVRGGRVCAWACVGGPCRGGGVSAGEGCLCPGVCLGTHPCTRSTPGPPTPLLCRVRVGASAPPIEAVSTHPPTHAACTGDPGVRVVSSANLLCPFPGRQRGTHSSGPPSMGWGGV